MVSRGLDKGRPDRCSQRRQGSAERAARVVGVQVGPQQVGQYIPGTRAVGEREVGQKGDCFAGVEPDRATVVLDLRRTHQPTAFMATSLRKPTRTAP